MLSARRISGGPIDIRVVRDITDEPGPLELWRGTLPLADGSGFVIVDESSAEPWCSGADTGGL